MMLADSLRKNDDFIDGIVEAAKLFGSKGRG
jgi:hypothetical protein